MYQSRRSDWRCQCAICPSTRLHSALGQEILLFSRLNMKYRAAMVAPPPPGFSCLYICVTDKKKKKSRCVSGPLVFHYTVICCVSVLNLSHLCFLSSIFFNWMLLNFTRLIWIKKSVEELDWRERERTQREPSASEDNHLVWKWLLWKLCLSCLSCGLFGIAPFFPPPLFLPNSGSKLAPTCCRCCCRLLLLEPLDFILLVSVFVVHSPEPADLHATSAAIPQQLRVVLSISFILIEWPTNLVTLWMCTGEPGILGGWGGPSWLHTSRFHFLFETVQTRSPNLRHQCTTAVYVPETSQACCVTWILFSLHRYH